MVRETPWALFPQVREISSFAVMLLVLLPDGWVAIAQVAAAG